MRKERRTERLKPHKERWSTDHRTIRLPKHSMTNVQQRITTVYQRVTNDQRTQIPQEDRMKRSRNVHTVQVGVFWCRQAYYYANIIRHVII